MSAAGARAQRRELRGNGCVGAAVATTERDTRAASLSMSPSTRRASTAAAGTLAALTLLACVRPAAAQQDLGSVVCVASELESLAGSGPVRRVIRRDTELAYRVGVDLSARAEAEQALRAELEAAGETSCAWSEPGQSHVVVVSYTGVVRQDLTIDPEDPRYQRFAVGYGTSWEEAEQFATTLNEHFATNHDGAGYEILVQETWGVANAQTVLPEGKICTGDYSPEGCWMGIANHPGCYLWNPFPQDDEIVTWSGGCSEGYAQGSGETTWYQSDQVSEIDVGLRQKGRSEGFWVITDPDGSRSEGSFADGLRHGVWTYFDANGRELRTVTWRNGRRVGG